MAGIFTSMDKVRPGAYLRFKAVKQNISGGNRGVVTLPMALPWGDTTALIPLTREDFTGSTTLAKAGLQISDEGMLPVSEAMMGATTVLVGRLNTDAVKATAAALDGEVTFAAVYGGSLGNAITVSCIANTESGKQVMYLVTSVRGVEADRQRVETTDDFKPNGWITLSVAPELREPLEETDYAAVGRSHVGVAELAPPRAPFAPFAGVTLAGGTDGKEVSVANYMAYFQASKRKTWNAMAVPTADPAITDAAVLFAKSLIEDSGRYAQIVVYNQPDANDEAVISVDQGYKTPTKTVPPEIFTCYVAGITAGAAITESNTYRVVEDAIDIINPKTDEDIVSGLQHGMFMLSFRQDNAVVVEKDINTLYAFGPDRNYSFSKNRVIRCLFDLATTLTFLFERSYIGKVSNNESGRTLYKGDCIGYLNSLLSAGAIRNWDPLHDIEILAGPDIESVIVNLAVQPVDSMEKLYMTVTVS